ncbi:MAG: sporulation protein YunB [Ruminococcaceae bacterium]|nr:sporulation protein YunB [Oscillospiraceae bacterium]
MRKKGICVLVVFLTFLIILLSAFFYTDKNLRLIILEMSESKIGTLMSDCANTAVNRAVKENGIKYDDIVRVTRDANNNITSIQTDIIKLNEIRTEIDYLFSEEMNRQPEIFLSIPIGTIIGNEYTVGRGPKINFRLDLSVNTSTDYTSKFYAAGINQTLHQICVEVSGSAYLLSPWYKTSIDFETSYIVAETVITGIVPETMADLNLNK